MLRTIIFSLLIVTCNIAYATYEIEKLISTSELKKQEALKEAQELVESIENANHKTILTNKDSSNLSKDAELLIFVSLNLPKNLLIELQHQAKRYSGTLVLRGLVNDSFKETNSLIMELVKLNNTGFLLDPESFERFNITQVPSYVIVENKHCLVHQNCAKFDKISGNISIDYFLKLVAKEGDLKDLIQEREL